MAMTIYESPQGQYMEVSNGNVGRLLPGAPQWGYVRIPVPGGGALWVEAQQQSTAGCQQQQYLPATSPQEIRLVYESPQKEGLWNSMTRGEKLATGLGIAAAAGAGIALAIAVANANSGGGCDLHSQVEACLTPDWDINVD